MIGNARKRLKSTRRRVRKAERQLQQTHHAITGKSGVASSMDRLIAIEKQLTEISSALAASEQTRVAEQDRLVAILRYISDEASLNRRRLFELRGNADYLAIYDDPEPLVSIPIPTHRNYRTLCDRALPSALGQTYKNIEIVVVGEDAPPETQAVIASFADDRIRYQNLNRRGPYPADPDHARYIAGNQPRVEAIRLSKGSWIANLDDDDAFRPGHVEDLLNLALSTKCEVAYGKMEEHYPARPSTVLGVFPPQLGHLNWTQARYHRGLTLFERQMSPPLFDIPADWHLVEKMLEAGVRFSMLDEVVADYYPSWFWSAEALERAGRVLGPQQ